MVATHLITCAAGRTNLLECTLIQTNFRSESNVNFPNRLLAVAVLTKILLKAGADVDAEADVYGGGATTLGLAATSIHPFRAGVQNPLLQILLDHGADIEHEISGGNRQNAVTGALANGRGDAAVFLADRGARLDLKGRPA